MPMIRWGQRPPRGAPPGLTPFVGFLVLLFPIFLFYVVRNETQLVNCMHLRHRQTGGCMYTAKANRLSQDIFLRFAFIRRFALSSFCSSPGRLFASGVEPKGRRNNPTKNTPRTSPNSTVAIAAAAVSVPEGPPREALSPSETAPIPAATAAPAPAPAAAAAAAETQEEWIVAVRLLHAPAFAAFASLVHEALQCLLWGSDSDVQVFYEFITLDQHKQEQQQEQQQQEQQQQEQQQELLRALEGGAVEVSVFFENRSAGGGIPGSSNSNSNSSSSNSSSTTTTTITRREERGRLLVRSLTDLAAAADLVVPAACRRPDGAAAIRMAAAALEQQQQVQQPIQQQLLLLQRCRAALPLRRGSLWSFLLCKEATMKMREKAREDILPIAVGAVDVRDVQRLYD